MRVLHVLDTVKTMGPIVQHWINLISKALNYATITYDDVDDNGSFLCYLQP